jgi:hypothetical protein
MAQILLLKANDIPRLTGLSGNIDIDKLTPNVFTAQVVDIKRVLGLTLYNKIVADYDADTLAGVYANIYNDYLIFILAYYSASYYIGFGNFHIVNNGIAKMNIEGGTSADSKEVNLLVDRYRQMAINFETELLKYLKTIDIPEYLLENEVNVKPIINWY